MKLKTATDGVTDIEATGDAVTLLVEQLQASDPQVRANAAVALGQLGPAAKDAVPALLEALSDETVASGSAVFALQQIGEGGDLVARALTVLLRDEQAFPTLRYQAAVALGRIGQFDPVLDLIKQEPLGWVPAAFSAMGPRSKDAVPAVAAMLKSEVPEHRAAAVDILSHMESHVKEAVPLITSLQNDADPMVREHVVSALDFVRLVKQNASRAK
jgi:HEAT repeat protein